MIRKIIKDTDPQLRKKSKEIEVFDEKISNLFDDLNDTLDKEEGVGLASPQVALLKRAFIIKFEGFYRECANPVILSQEGEQIGPEGCLSVDNRQEMIKRPLVINVSYQDRYGNKKNETLQGFEAVVFCHERDHLDGILFYDHKGE